MSGSPVTSGSQRSQRATGLAGDLAVLARAHWPPHPGARLPAIANFVSSSFSPLAAAVAEQCLLSYFGSPPAQPDRGERTAIILASATGDLGTATAIASAVDGGRRVPPLLFFQGTPNAIAGHIAARWALAGPLVTTIAAADALADAISCATLLIEDGDAAAALIVIADQDRDGDDRGTALLLGPASWPSAVAAGTRALSSLDDRGPPASSTDALTDRRSGASAAADLAQPMIARTMAGRAPTGRR